jgi:transcriptional regulator with PAS, ATPase and Fis domain
MQQVFDLISSASQSEAPVIIYGDSGTGKELVASAIHKLGVRRKGPFIKVNCAALSESLLESELFGHVKGAFTGADRTRMGRFEAANGGDIFLDEIGDLPLATQVKLLRVLQEKEIEKVGDHRPITIDVRILAATNKDLYRLMEEGHFREDLYYRIGVIPIILPPLQERREDIPLLVETFINRIRLKTDKPISGMSREALDVLFGYDWPGNVRELINVIEYSFVLCHEGEIMPHHLPAKVTGTRPSVSPRRRAVKKQSDDVERKRILDALAATGGNQSKAAEILGISRVTLWKRLKAYDIQVDRKVSG